MKPISFFKKHLPHFSGKWKNKKSSLQKLCNMLECDEIFLSKNVNYNSNFYKKFKTYNISVNQENLNPYIKTKSIKQHQKKKHHENTKQKIQQLKISF